MTFRIVGDYFRYWLMLALSRSFTVTLQTARPMMLPVSQIDGKKIKQMAAQGKYLVTSLWPVNLFIRIDYSSWMLFAVCTICGLSFYTTWYLCHCMIWSGIFFPLVILCTFIANFAHFFISEIAISFKERIMSVQRRAPRVRSKKCTQISATCTTLVLL